MTRRYAAKSKVNDSSKSIKFIQGYLLAIQAEHATNKATGSFVFQLYAQPT